MNLQNKIDEIRRKPEHIRIRYAWGSAIFLTLVVVIIWVVSLATQDSRSKDNNPLFSPQEMQSFNDLKTQKDSLEKATDTMKKSFDSQQNPGSISQQQSDANNAASN